MGTPVNPGLRPAPARSWRARRLDANDRLGLRLTVAAVAAFLVLVPFALLAVLVVGDWTPLHHLDRSVTDALHTDVTGHPGLVRAMVIWCYIVHPNSLRVAALVLVVWLIRRRARRMAWWVIATMAVGGILEGVLKLLVGRNRPDLLDPVARAAGFSFPSGHALNAALAAGVFLMVFLPVVRRRRVWLWAAAIIVVGVTGFCRVALGVHWTSDVVGGWLLGVAVVAATAAAFDTWRQTLPSRRSHADGTSAPASRSPVAGG
jgi:membrane-associated phospholipid phosphatase